MAWPVTLNGRTYTSADFDGTNYVAGLPDAFEDFATHAASTMQGTSTSSVAIGTGSKSFTTQAGKTWAVGTPLRIANTSSPSTQFMDVVVTSYNSGTGALVVNSVGITGTGTIATWTISPGGGGYALSTPVPVASGGTAATTAAAALTSLGAVPLAGGTMTGPLLVTGSSGTVQTVSTGDQVQFTFNGFNYINATGAAATLQLQASGASGSVTLSTNGAERMRAASDGTITVGTATKLTVNSFIAAFQNTGTTAVAATDLIGRFSADANPPGEYFVKSRGASIGTHGLVSSGDQVGNIAWYASDGAAYQPVAFLRAEVDGTAAAGDMPGRLVFGTTTDGGVTAAERMRIDNVGNTFHNVTAYTVATDTKVVHLKGPNSGSGFGAFVAESGVAAKQAVFECAGSNGDCIVGTQSTNTTGYLALFAGGVEVMRASALGDVGVGVTPANSADVRTLYVKGPNSGLGYAGLRVEGGTNTKQAILQISGSNGDCVVGPDVNNTTGNLNFIVGGSSRMMVLPSAGEVCVGTTALLGVSGTTGALVARHLFGSRHAIRCEDNAATTASQIGFYNTNGLVGAITTLNSATSYGTSSDHRLKENEVPISDGLSRLMALQPYRLNFISSPEETVDGFFAHEVQAICPEAVIGEQDGEDFGGNPVYQSIDHSKLVPLLVAAVKELAADYAAYKVAHP
jgi:hypothetical protein